MADYTPNPNVYHPVIAIPDDGSDHDAASWGMAYEQLADNAAHVQRFEGGWYVFNWHSPVMIPGEFAAPVNGVAAVVVQSAAAGGVPVLCALGTDGVTRRVTCASGGSNSDASALFAPANPPAIAIAGGIYDGAPTLLAIRSDGYIGISDDLGMTWAMDLATFGFAQHVVGYFAAHERWIITTVNSVTPTIARIFYVDAGTPWAEATGLASAPTTTRRFACNETAAIIVYSGAESECARSLDGIAWTLLTLTAAPHDWHGVAYSLKQDRWMAVASDGVGAISEDGGASWTEIALPSGAQDVIAFGRWFVIVCTNVHGGLGASVAVSDDVGDTWREFVIDSDALASAYERLLVFGDGIVAVGRDELDRMRVAFSLRAPTL
jgi:hypothetical protein